MRTHRKNFQWLKSWENSEYVETTNGHESTRIQIHKAQMIRTGLLLLIFANPLPTQYRLGGK
jgi:hypothetical protein